MLPETDDTDTILRSHINDGSRREDVKKIVECAPRSTANLYPVLEVARSENVGKFNLSGSLLQNGAKRKISPLLESSMSLGEAR